MTRIMISAVLATVLLMGAITPGEAQEYRLRPRNDASPELMAADAILGRPLGVVATVGGLGLFIASLPFTIASGSTNEAAQKLVGEPASWTFQRPLGQTDPRYPGAVLP